MAHQEKALAMQAWQPELYPQNPQKDGKRKPIPPNCPNLHLHIMAGMPTYAINFSTRPMGLRGGHSFQGLRLQVYSQQQQ